jgi:hypothetical protein
MGMPALIESALRDAARRLAEESCRAQGLPAKVTDAHTVAAVCTLLTGRLGRGGVARERDAGAAA